MISFVFAQLIFIIGIITLFIVLSRLIKSKFLNRKRNQWLIIGYIVILITAFSITYMLPINNQKQANHIKMVNGESIPNLYVVPELTGSIEMAKDYLVDEWTFDIEGKKLNIETLGEESWSNIAIETKGNSSDTIDVALYVTPNVVENIDMTTGNLPPTNVSLQDNKLTVQTPDPVEVSVSQVKKEFPIRQFTDPDYLNDNPDWGTGFGVHGEASDYSYEGPYIEPEDNRIFSTELLYIKVPADIDVEANEDLNIFFVNQE